MKKIKDKYSNLSPSVKFALIIIVIVGFALIFYSGLFIKNILHSTDLHKVIIYSLPFVMGIFTLAGAVIILIGQVTVGAWTVLIINTLGMIIISYLAQGYSFTPAIWILLIAITIPLPILPRKHQFPILILSILGAIGSVLMDTFWIGEKIIISQLEKQVAIYIAIILGLILISYLTIRYKHFRLRVKIAIAFLGLTIISVSLISAQSVTLTSRYLTSSIGGQVNQVAEANALALGNEINRLVSVLSSFSFSVSLQDEIKNSMQVYSETQLDIHEYIHNLDVEWKQNIDSDRNSSLIYDRITNPVAIELRVISYRIPNLGNTFVADRYGALVGSLTPISQYDFSTELWWDSVYNQGDGAVYIGLPVYDYDIQGTSILIAVPVFDRIGNYFIGIVGTKIPFDGYVKSLNRAAHKLGERAGITLIFPGDPPLVLGETEIQTCKSNGRDPIAFQVGSDSINIVVSKENSFLTNLSTDQLKNIFTTAEIWSDIDASWPDKPILRYTPSSESGTFDYFVNTVLNDDLSAIMNLNNLYQNNDERNYLERIANDPYAIGITGGGYFNQFRDKLTVLSIDGVYPNLKEADSGKYLLNRPLFVYTSGEILRDKPQVSAFINYFLNHTSGVAEKVGYSPPSEASLKLAKANLIKAMGVTEIPSVNPGNLNGDITVGGSSTVYLLTRMIADGFINDGYKGNITIDSSDTGLGIKQFCLLSNIDIVNASRKINDNPRISVQDYLVDTLRLGKEFSFFEQELENTANLVSTASVIDLQESEFISKMGWVVVAHNPTYDALAPLRTQERASIAILIVIGIAATIGALGLAHLLAGPIQRLSLAAHSFGAGELTTRAEVESNDEIGNLASTFNSMADQIRQIMAGLENQVNERTQAVVVTAEISSRLSTILDQRELVLAVVEEIRRSYNFYHAHIYLYDNNYKNLIMVGGTGEAGKIMMERGHTIEPGHGLVGRCAQTNSIFLVTDTNEDPSWLSNPLLPETKSEVAVPIAIGDKVLGVLDVQHNIPSGINQQTAELLKSIANQVAIAVQNARLYTEAQIQAEQEALIIDINKKIQNSTTIESVLEITARELGLALGASKASVIIDQKHFRDNQTNFVANN